MRDERLSGTALVAGAAAALVTMAFHPTGASLVAAGEQGVHLARLAALTHALALAAIPVMALGALGLTRRVERGGWGRLALSSYGTALAASLCATVGSGLVGPQIARRMASAEGPRREALEVVFLYTGLVSRAFTGVFVVASAAAVLLWSILILLRRSLHPGLGVSGTVIAALILFLFLTGHVRLNVHGLGLLVLAQSAWLAAAGVALIRSASRPLRRSPSAP